MFDTLKIYTRKEIPVENVRHELVRMGYRGADEIGEEGDFSFRGDTLEIFPVNFNFPLRVEWEYGAIDKIYSFDKTLNKKIIDYDFLIIIPYFKKSKHKYNSEDMPLDAVLRIIEGDYVVHSKYGIGKFLGIKKMPYKDKEDYFFEIAYENNDKLYVSKEQAHLIQKYVNFGNKAPKLSRLGSKEWTRLKEKVERGIKSFALEMLRMEAQRKIIGGIRYSPDGEWQKLFEESFPYEETEDQLKSMQAVKVDMESSGCMDRIVCGDVGYGKTEVAMRAAVKAVVDGKQVAILVPTTTLAYQHFITLSNRMGIFPVKIEMLSRFRSHRQQQTVIKNIAAGKVEIVVGTHRLLSDDVAFKELGLLIIDEEHKFGVRHKEKIKKIKVGIDVLTLSATPIPRTLYMGLIGLKNISLIKTPPKDRLAVRTSIIEFDPQALRDAILKEIRRNGEVFIVHNRIHSIQRVAKILRDVLPQEVKMAVVHGRMPAKDIEQAMLDFMEKRINCLVSTAIMESGIDIPSANTIIINDAHTFGLADLHQLRGRVGRMDLQAHAYLVVPKFHRVSSEAMKRLRLIEEFSHLGAGFDVAMSDLEMRGAGNILGKEQHGFVSLVGFDLYCRLLKKEIEYLKEAFKIEVG